MRTPPCHGFLSLSFHPISALVLVVAAALLLPGQAPAVTFVVNNAGDTHDASPGSGGCADALGACTLRAAIEESEALAGADTINFAIGLGGLVTIAPASALPSLTDASGTTIDGTTQPPGWSGTPLVELDGTGAGVGVNGLTLLGGNSTIRGLAINRFGSNGISIYESDDNVVDLCFIGTDPTGTNDRGNTAPGIGINNGDDNVIGTAAVGRRNLIAGNGSSGIAIFGGSQRTILRGNFIGVNATGTAEIANDMYGVYIAEASTNNRVGDVSGGVPYGNLISGNTSAGVGIFGSGTTGNLVNGNIIGLGATMTGAIPNAAGVAIDSGASNNSIGGAGANDFNIISGNTGLGVSIHASNDNTVAHNAIGTDLPGLLDLGNGSSGVQVHSASGNTIGGAAGGNLIMGNGGNGVVIQAGNGNTVAGNLIGVPIGGVAIGNDNDGVALVDTSGNTIGGTAANAGNLISGNAGNGVVITGAASTGNVFQGNRIGANAAATAAVPNVHHGIVLNGAGANTIGGTGANELNVISGNGYTGMYVTGGSAGTQVVGNLIGLSLTGADLGNGTGGIWSGVQLLDGATTNTFTGNFIGGNSGAGIRIAGSTTTGNTFTGNYIGTNLTGLAARGNDGIGLEIWEGTNNVIGGTGTGQGNVISGNGAEGVAIRNGGTGNQILGNLIGTNAAGLAALANGGAGVWTADSPNNSIGGSAAGAGNVISGNGGHGIEMSGATTTGNVVQGNFIGTNAGGTVNLGNSGHGIELSSAPDNTIGGTGAREGNTIAFNGGDGVCIEDPPPCTQKSVLGNSIHSNLDLGIDLANNGVTPNDLDDPDTGPNNLQNFPVLSEVASNPAQTLIRGSLNSLAGTYRIEFFASPTCDDPSGYGEGQRYLGYTDVTLTTTNADFEVTLPVEVEVGYVVTATATDESGSTSEFSACAIVAELQAEPIPLLGTAGMAALLLLLAVVGAVVLRGRLFG